LPKTRTLRLQTLSASLGTTRSANDLRGASLMFEESFTGFNVVHITLLA